MKIKIKPCVLILFVILSAAFCLSMGSAYADGISSEGYSETPFTGQVRAGESVDYIINLNALPSTDPPEYAIIGNFIELKEGNTYEITGNTTTYGIKTNMDCTILLNNASIAPAIDGVIPLDLNQHQVTVLLADGTTNTLDGKGTASPTGIGAPGIRSSDSTLTIEGNGILNTTGGRNCAGIGGEASGAGGTVTITGSATVTATGGFDGAGIGGGPSGAGGTVTITGSATVTATAGNFGAGIGGGNNGVGGTVMITDQSTVTATGGYYAAGIGGGYNAAGIGGGYDATGGTVTITGSATVTVTGGTYGAGIGGGNYASGGTVTITDQSSVTVTGGYDGAGIGGGNYGAGGTVTITGQSSVTATAGNYAAGIGGGYDGDGGTVTITGSATVTATGGYCGAGIGGGYNAAGIGGGSDAAGGTVTIRDQSTVTATGGDQGAGIGGGYKGVGGTVTITDQPTVTATGGDKGAGIGGGYQAVGGTGSISGGNVLSVPGASATSSQDMAMYTDPAFTKLVYQNTLTLSGVSFPTVISSMDTSDTLSYTLVGAKTITTSPTSQVISLWLPETTSSEVLLLEVNSQKYIATYQRLNQTVTQPLTRAYQVIIGSSSDGSAAIDTPVKLVQSYVAENDPVTMTATSNIGSLFKEWSASGIVLGDKAQNPLTFIMPSTNITLTPLFETRVTGITLDKSDLQLLPSLSESLTATVQPTNATNKQVTWQSSDTTIATVDTMGVVTAKAVGKATITATTVDGNYSATCTVTVGSSSTSSSSTSSSNTPAGSSGGNGLSYGNGGDTKTSKEFWYPHSSGTSSSSSSNGGSATVPDSPNYNPVTGGETGNAPVFFGFSITALLSSLAVMLIKRKNRKNTTGLPTNTFPHF